MNQQVHLVLILTLIGSSVGHDGRTSPMSPCPAVYRYESEGGWHGVITIVPPLSFSEVRLEIQQTVSYYQPGLGVGRIEVKGAADEVDQIAQRAANNQRQTIQYNVIYPAYDEIPRISSVKFNGQEFCSSTASSSAGGKIKLEYSLKTGLDLAVASGSQFSTDGGSFPPNTRLVPHGIPQHHYNQQWSHQQPRQPQKNPQRQPSHPELVQIHYIQGKPAHIDNSDGEREGYINNMGTKKTHGQKSTISPHDSSTTSPQNAETEEEDIDSKTKIVNNNNNVHVGDINYHIAPKDIKKLTESVQELHEKVDSLTDQIKAKAQMPEE